MNIYLYQNTVVRLIEIYKNFNHKSEGLRSIFRLYGLSLVSACGSYCAVF
jgi:hypothetical protein